MGILPPDAITLGIDVREDSFGFQCYACEISQKVGREKAFSSAVATDDSAKEVLGEDAVRELLGMP